MSPLFYAFVLVAAGLAVEGLHSIIVARRRQGRVAARRRLRKMTRRIQSPNALDDESLLRAVVQEGGSLWERAVGSIPGRTEIELRLYRAGLAMTPERFLAVTGALAGAVWVLTLAFLGDLAMAVVLAGVAACVPWVQVGRLRGQRILNFEKQFPDALDLMIRALRAGHSLTAGFAMVGEELPDPIGAEFTQLADEIQLGQPTRKALQNLSFRVPSADLPFFTTAISIQQETGSNLAEVLENLGQVMRERFKLLGKVRTLTAMGRASANLLAAWPVVTVAALYLVNPEYVAPLWEEETGRMLVVVSVCMVIAGYFLCRKMATIKV
jgi:tight adherence protein B